LNLKKWERLVSLQKGSEDELYDPQTVRERFLKLVESTVERNQEVLVLGASEREIRGYRKIGLKNVIGINFWPGKNIRKMDIHDLNFKKETFDAVIAKNVMEHAHCEFLVFLEVRSVLKEGGLFIFTHQKIETPGNFFIEHPTLVNREWLVFLAGIFGFKIRRMEEEQFMFYCVWEKSKSTPAGTLSGKDFQDFINNWEREFH